MPSLLAKSDPNVTVLQHSTDVYKAACKILEHVDLTKVSSINPDRVSRILRVAAICHDLGKATNLFQLIVTHGVDARVKCQPIRHELASCLIVSFYWEWFVSILGEEDARILVWAISAHHLKCYQTSSTDAHQQSVAPFATERNGRPQAVDEIHFYINHPEIESLFGLLATVCGSTIACPKLEDKILPVVDFTGKPDLEQLVDDFILAQNKSWDTNATKEIRATLGLCRTLLMMADISASALPDKYESFIDEVFNEKLKTGELKKVASDVLNGRPLRQFQKDVAESQADVTICVAGCGEGKTIAGYLWGETRKFEKLIMTYPTTHTASSGYADYMLGQELIDSALVHSRSHIDLEYLLSDLSLDQSEMSDLSDIYHTFVLLSQKVVVCTYDTVLGAMQNNRRGLLQVPSILLNTGVIFDEVHSYDNYSFGSLVRFIQTFDRVPILIMTATLPNNKFDIIQKACGNRSIKIVHGDKKLAAIKRYRIFRSTQQECLQIARDWYHRGFKVLWVCNVVEHAMNIFDMLSHEKPLLFHSRYEYEHRVMRQRDIMAAFKSDKPVIAISTQVCEMSLDISAFCLISQDCPLFALGQRLGRVNRRLEYSISPCYVYPFGKPGEGQPPYLDDVVYLDAERNFVDQNNGKDIGQGDIADVFSSITSNSPISYASSFLGLSSREEHSNGLPTDWQCVPRALRSIQGTISVIRSSRAKELRQKFGDKPPAKEVARWVIPMLEKKCPKTTDRIGCYPVVPDESMNYSEVRGGRWI